MLFQQTLKRVKKMKKYQNRIEESAKETLISCLSSVPFLRIDQISKKSDPDTFQEFDLVTKVELADGVMTLIAAVKSSGQPRFARGAVNQILRFKEKIPDSYFVFIAPYISPRSAEICKSEGIGYLDLSGNCLLSFDKIYIEKTDYPNRFKEKRELKSLYAPKAERILRALLCNPGKKWKIKELAAEGNVSLGQASNIKKILYDQEFIAGRRGGFRLREPATILRDWAENYNYRKNNIQELYSLKMVADVENTITDYCNKKQIRCALTGFSGAARIEPAVRYKKAMVYADLLTEDDFSEMSLKPVKSGGNLLLFSPYDEGVFYRSFRINGVQIVSEIQLYLDLQGFRGRGEEAAEALYSRIMEKPW